MKRTLSLVIMAAALLLTQCKKPSIEFPTPSVTTTVNMTITAGPGSKTDITTEGGIVWSANDKIYVGDGSKYVGFLTLVGDGGDATGTFTGYVTATAGTNKTFHFYYLGNANDYSADLASNNKSVVVDFSNQNIYEDSNKLKNASGQHVGYGKVEGVDVEADKPITGIQVDMKSKVAIAYFSFTRAADGGDYTGALTLSGENIYNKMTVKFDESDFSFTGTKGSIRLAGGRCERYAMLVPAGTSAATLNFGGCVSGTTTLANGIEANKFYRIDGRDPIVVEVTPFVFSVASGTTVEFSPGNLWYGKAEGEDEPAFHFEGSQTYNTTEFVANHIDRFYWSKTESVAYMEGEYSDAGAQTTDVFFTNDPSDKTKPNTGFQVSGETAGTWRTLSSEEWRYLLNTSNNASGARTDKNRFAKAKVNDVNGLLIFPDGYNNNVIIESIHGVANVNTTDAGYPTDSIPADKWAAMESFGVVFLPAAGVGGNGIATVWWRNERGHYNSSDLTYGGENPYNMTFTDKNVQSGASYVRNYRESVRLVRSCPAL